MVTQSELEGAGIASDLHLSGLDENQFAHLDERSQGSRDS